MKGYSVYIKDKWDGHIHRADFNEDYDDWDSDTWYMWAEGNYSCDCNRGIFYGEWKVDETECGTDRFDIVMVSIHGKCPVFLDGTDFNESDR